jgi:hypothetical protein
MTSARAEHFTYHQRPDGIMVLTFKSLTSEAVDAWFHYSSQIDAYVVQNNIHLRTLYIIEPGVYMNTETIQKTIAYIKLTPPNLVESATIVISESLLGTLIKIITQQMKHFVPDPNLLVTMHVEEALKWLDERKQIVFEERQIPSLTFQNWDNIIMEELG